MKSVLIIGAGVTRAAGANKSKKRSPPLDTDFFQIAHNINKTLTESVDVQLHNLLGSYADEVLSSLETATTYLFLKALDSKSGDPHHHAFLNLLELLEKVLAHTTNGLPNGRRSLIYRFILSELKKVDRPEDLTIITFNYDTLLERVLNSLSRSRKDVFAFPGCYRLDKIRSAHVHSVTGEKELATERLDHIGVSILKLHGSLNWRSKHTSFTPTPSALTKPNRELHIANSARLIEGLTWMHSKRTVYLKPIIVPPISGKRGIMHNDILPLWGLAGRALRDADRVVIAGYSCPPLDLESRMLISENHRADDNKSVYVINPDARVVSRFVRLCGVDHTTVYGSIGDWIRDAR